MKLNRSKFDYLVEKFPNHKVYKIGTDKYIEFITFKGWIRCLGELGKTLLVLPCGIILATLELVKEIPEYIKTLAIDMVSIVPIRYFKVVDDEEIESME